MTEYKITPRQENNAIKENVIIFPSKRKNKKLDVYDENGDYLLSIGDKRYKDYSIFLEEEGKKFADDRKRLYKIRHNKTRHIKGSSSYYSDKILWN